MPGHARRHSAMSCAKLAEHIEMPLDPGLGWAQGNMCYMEVHIGEVWQI